MRHLYANDFAVSLFALTGQTVELIDQPYHRIACDAIDRGAGASPIWENILQSDTTDDYVRLLGSAPDILMGT